MLKINRVSLPAWLESLVCHISTCNQPRQESAHHNCCAEHERAHHAENYCTERDCRSLAMTNARNCWEHRAIGAGCFIKGCTNNAIYTLCDHHIQLWCRWSEFDGTKSKFEIWLTTLTVAPSVTPISAHQWVLDEDTGDDQLWHCSHCMREINGEDGRIPRFAEAWPCIDRTVRLPAGMPEEVSTHGAPPGVDPDTMRLALFEGTSALSQASVEVHNRSILGRVSMIEINATIGDLLEPMRASLEPIPSVTVTNAQLSEAGVFSADVSIRPVPRAPEPVLCSRRPCESLARPDMMFCSVHNTSNLVPTISDDGKLYVGAIPRILLPGDSISIGAGVGEPRFTGTWVCVEGQKQLVRSCISGQNLDYGWTGPCLNARVTGSALCAEHRQLANYHTQRP